MPTLVLDMASLSPSQYPRFSITHASAAALSRASKCTFISFLYSASSSASVPDSRLVETLSIQRRGSPP